MFHRADLFQKQEENGRKEAATRKNLEQHGKRSLKKQHLKKCTMSAATYYHKGNNRLGRAT